MNMNLTNSMPRKILFPVCAKVFYYIQGTHNICFTVQKFSNCVQILIAFSLPQQMC